MCTVTLAPAAAGYRLMMNRDEQRHRAPELAPQAAWIGGLEAVFPRDPQGGGTWIGANAAGLSFALLNLNEGASSYAPAGGGGASRGVLIPALLGARTLEAAQAAFSALDLETLRPFRLAATDGVRALTWHSRRGCWSEAAIGRGLMWTSSGLGDAQVEGPRRALWESLPPLLTREAQARFHAHAWAQTPHLSVCMARDDARTVSMTEIAVEDAHVRMLHHPHWPTSGVHSVALAREAA